MVLFLSIYTRTSPSLEMAPPPTQSAPYPTQYVEGAVVLVPPQIEEDDDYSIFYGMNIDIKSYRSHLGPASKMNQNTKP
ncbi:hypothetical protein GBA52_026566 [Prunus armeniaca]|nr:hypothetical protein GBA52_026566 [Prunus armeniaca]